MQVFRNKPHILWRRNLFPFRNKVGALPLLCDFATVLRRHLTESQRAMAAAKLANIAHGGNRRVEQVANLQLETPSLPTFEPEAPKAAPVSQSEAARLLNVSPRTVATAKKVQDPCAAGSRCSRPDRAHQLGSSWCRAPVSLRLFEIHI